MRSIGLGLFVCVFLIPVLTKAQSAVDGKWAGEVQGGRGPQMVALTLKAEGGKLTGTSTGGRGGDVPIENGSFANNALKFVTHQMGRGGQVTFNWGGMPKGDEIAMKRSVEGREGGPQEFTRKRQ